jgi:chaperonin GroES
MSKLKITPINGRVILKLAAPEEKTASGIIIPTTTKEQPKIYEVVAISDGKRLKNGKIINHILKVGQKVLCPTYAGDEAKISLLGEEYKIIDEDSITAIIE